MKNPIRALFVVLFLFLTSLPALAQQKLLTIDDIFDPAKKVNFSGTTPNIRWLKDGTSYLLSNDPAKKDVPRLQRVNALTGEATLSSIQRRCKQPSLPLQALLRRTPGS